jgi:hypothetical protein
VYKLSTPTDISARVMVGPKKGCRTAWEPLDATHSARSASRSSPRGGGKCCSAVLQFEEDLITVEPPVR